VEGVSWQVVGQLERSLHETLEMVAEVETMTAPILAERIESAVNTASNRLKRLYDVRLISRKEDRTEKGLQYRYQFWEWDT
jgi:predicted transcriptional regulator